MPNFAGLIRDEVRRLARKETRAVVSPLRKQINSLRRRVAQQRQLLAKVERAARTAVRHAGGAPQSREEAGGARSRFRFSAAWMRKHRARLKMSREKYAKLLGSTAQSVLGWESGRTRPRQKTVELWARLRQMGVREIRSALEAMRGEKRTRRRPPRRTRRRPARRRPARRSARRPAARRKVRSRKSAARRR